MLLTLLREIEDQTTKLGSCLERGDTDQALTHHAEIRSLIIEVAVAVLRHEKPGNDAQWWPPNPLQALALTSGQGFTPGVFSACQPSESHAAARVGCFQWCVS